MNMKKNNKGNRAPALALALVMLLAALLGGCSKAPAAPAADENIVIIEADSSTEPAEEAPAAPGRQDGERFETVIILEGMEETVQYEHIISRALGFEMDYDYESFERYSDPELECFISVWDGLGNPENFLEVTRREEDADTVAAIVREEFSGKYDLTESTRELEGAGECLYIEASVLKGTNTMADELQAVYIIPASDGCFVAAAHYTIEAAEGFGRRFNYMLQTFSAIY